MNRRFPPLLPVLAAAFLAGAPAAWSAPPAKAPARSKAFDSAQAKAEAEEPAEPVQSDTDLIDVPTASVLDYGSYSGRARVFTGGGVLGWMSFGVFQRLQIGASLNTDKLIGADTPVHLASPELQAKYRFSDGTAVMPAFAVGFDGQGLFYNRPRKEYVERRRGLYVVGTKEAGATGLFGHAGFNVADFDRDLFFGFLGVSWNIEDKAALLAEWDNIRSASDSRLNAGVRFYATPELSIDFAVREIGRGGTASGVRIHPERIVQLKYTGSF